MSNPCILVILDGLGYQTATENMPYMFGAVEKGEAQFQKLYSETPVLSRPLYETILTGIPPKQSGVLDNDVVRNSYYESVFSCARKASKKTAASAYHWVSELYVKAPFDRYEDRLLFDSDSTIQNGIFYYQDPYPDSHVFSDAEYLLRRCDPDFLLIHSMNIDNEGHGYGSESEQYRNATRTADKILSEALPHWLEKGYSIIVTADHGMSPEGGHSGPGEQEIPFFYLPNRSQLTRMPAKQTSIARFACDIMGIAAAETMPRE